MDLVYTHAGDPGRKRTMNNEEAKQRRDERAARLRRKSFDPAFYRQRISDGAYDSPARLEVTTRRILVDLCELGVIEVTQ